METMHHKAKRIVASSFIAVILIFTLMPIAGSIGQSLNAPFQSPSSPSGLNQWVVYSGGKQVPVAAGVNGNVLYVPAASTSIVILTNETIAKANSVVLSFISLEFTSNVAENLTVSLAMGNATSNIIVAQHTVAQNGADTGFANFSFKAYYYTFPISSHFVFIIQHMVSNSQFLGVVSAKTTSSVSARTVFSPLEAVEAGSVVLDIILLALLWFTLPFSEARLPFTTQQVVVRRRK